MKDKKNSKITQKSQNQRKKAPTKLKLRLNLLAKIKKQKEDQRKIQKIIQEELKKIETLRISIEGIQTLSDSSVKSIQDRREKAVKAINKATHDLSISTETMKNIENQIRKINHE